MTAPNPAVDAQPGWRGTDPDGGTWVLVRIADDLAAPWFAYAADGSLIGWRSQEEAEAADLVPLRADGPASALIRAGADATRPPRKPAPAPLGVDKLAQVIREVDGNHALGAGALAEAVVKRLGVAAPAPLDPGNPEHLREVDKFLGRFYASIGMASSSAGSVCKQLRSVADRLDRERAEAEQDAADRKLAEEVAGPWALNEDAYDAHVESVLAGIRAADERAGRAERQEAGQ